MKKMYCDYNPNDRKYYCSTKTRYGLLYPEKCGLILKHEELFNYIKDNQDKFIYELPFMVAHDFENKLKKEGE